MHTAYLISVWLHIIAAMTWIGGMLFLVTVLVPMLRSAEMRPKAAELFHVIGVRFRVVGWVALTTLIITGTFNITIRGYTLGQIVSLDVFAGPWGKTLAHKLGCVGLILILSGLHDFWLGPKATRLARGGAAPEERERFRRVASLMGRATLLLALAVVAFAVALVRG